MGKKMPALKTILIMAFLFLPGRLICLAGDSNHVPVSEILPGLKIEKEWTGIQLTFDAQQGILEVKKSTGKGNIDARDVIQILKTDRSVRTVKFLDVTITGNLDLTALPLREYLLSKVFLVDKSLVFENCNFTGKITSRNTSRLRVTFMKPVDFIECNFQGEVSLEHTRFDEALTVKSSFFHENAVFYDTQSKKKEDRVFSDIFSDVTFEKTLIFSMSTFERKINFFNLRCNGNAYFRYIKSIAIDFSGSHFSGEVDFGGSKFGGEVCFEDVNFDAQLFFVKVEKMEKSKFVHFDFDGANFKGKAYFRESFLGKADFRSSQDKSLIFFDEAIFRKVTFKEADFTGASFHTVDFSQAVFGDREAGQGLSLKDCSYKQMTVSWEQLSGSLLNNLEDEDFLNLKANFEEMKKFNDACDVYYLMKTNERKKSTDISKKFLNYISWLFGYFVRPSKIIVELFILALLFAFCYTRTELKAFSFKSFKKKKDKRKVFINEIPIEAGLPAKIPPPFKKEKKEKGASYPRRLVVSFVFSLKLLFKINLKANYIGREARQWIKVAARIEWWLGYGMWLIFLYALARRSSILRDILGGLPII